MELRAIPILRAALALAALAAMGACAGSEGKRESVDPGKEGRSAEDRARIGLCGGRGRGEQKRPVLGSLDGGGRQEGEKGKERGCVHGILWLWNRGNR